MSHQICVVCHESYEFLDHQERKPKLLDCHHTFCKLCLQALVDVSGSITCPTCRKVTKVGDKNGVAKLQSNFYILNYLMDKYEERSSLSTASSTLPIPPAEDLSWCRQCRSSESAECRFKRHVTVDLSKDEDLKDSITELQLYVDTCKFKWTSALTQRERAAESVDAVNAALYILGQKAKALQRENQTKISQLRNHLKGAEKVSAITSSNQQMNGNKMKELLLKNSSMAEKSDEEYRAASVLGNSVKAIAESTATVLVKNSKGSDQVIIPTPLFQGAKLGFTSSKADAPEEDSHLLTALSFLCLAAGPSGEELLKHLKLWAPPAPSASAPSKPLKPRGRKQKPHKTADGDEDFVIIENPNSNPINAQHNPGKPQHQQLGGSNGKLPKQHSGAHPSTVPPHVRKIKNQQQTKHQEGDHHGGAKPKQPKANKKSEKNPGNNNAIHLCQPKETTSNLGDMLKQAAIEAAIEGLQSLTVSLHEEKISISAQKKNKK